MTHILTDKPSTTVCAPKLYRNDCVCVSAHLECLLISVWAAFLWLLSLCLYCIYSILYADWVHAARQNNTAIFQHVRYIALPHTVQPAPSLLSPPLPWRHFITSAVLRALDQTKSQTQYYARFCSSHEYWLQAWCKNGSRVSPSSFAKEIHLFTSKVSTMMVSRIQISDVFVCSRVSVWELRAQNVNNLLYVSNLDR